MIWTIRKLLSGVYPRVCGGTSTCLVLPVNPDGLSPRVRGNRFGGGMMQVMCGSIPACAGEPPLPCLPPCLPGVYPRVCGGTVDFINMR